MAGSAFSGESDDLIADINVTPLVDVVLVLLIVMMITMPTIVSIDILNERELNVSLPEASAALPLTAVPDELVVNVDQEGRYTVRENAYTEETLLELLSQANADNPGRASVVIRADRRCFWQAVVTVMNLCNQANIRDYRVSTSE